MKFGHNRKFDSKAMRHTRVEQDIQASEYFWKENFKLIAKNNNNNSVPKILIVTCRQRCYNEWILRWEWELTNFPSGSMITDFNKKCQFMSIIFQMIAILICSWDKINWNLVCLRRFIASRLDRWYRVTAGIGCSCQTSLKPAQTVIFVSSLRPVLSSSVNCREAVGQIYALV